MLRTKRVYTDAFRLNAVRRAITEGLPITELALQLQVSTNSLYRWRAKYRKLASGNGGPKKPVVLATSGDLSKAHLLHNRRFACQVWDGEKWVDYGDLALFENTGFLKGEKLYNLHYHPESQSLLYSFGKAQAHRSGRFYMTQDHRAFIGTMQLSADGPLTMTRGAVPTTVFNTQREKKSTEQFVDWLTFSLGGEWVDEPTGKYLKAIFKLGDQDVSNRTAATNVHQWQTTIQMIPDPNPFGGQDQFTIVVDYQGQTFLGTYTDGDGTVYDWKGTAPDASVQAATANANSFVLMDGKPQANLVPLMAMTAEARAADDTGPSLTVQDLMNVSSIQSVEVKGVTKILDTAQVQTGKYFQSILINALTGTDNQGNAWISDFFGGPQPIAPNVQAVMNAHLPFYQSTSVMNMGQMIHDSLLNDPAHKDVVALIDNDKLATAWKTLGTNKDYGLQSSALYVEGYRDGVPGIQPYLGANAKDWASQLYNHITSDDFLSSWAVLVASGAFKNVRQQMYEWYVQLLVLDPGNVNQANKMLSTTFGIVIGSAFNKTTWNDDLKPYLAQAIQNMLDGDTSIFTDTILQNNAAAMSARLKEMVSNFDTVEEFTDQLVNALTVWSNKPGNIGRPVVQAGQDLAEMFDVFKTIRVQAGQVFTSLMFAAGAGYIIYELIDDQSLNPVQDIGLAMLATGFIIKSIEKIMATFIGDWLLKPAADGAWRITKIAKNVGKWFTEAGVETDSWVTTIMGKSSAEFFAKRLGPALAVVGIAISAWQLANDIMAGDVRDIVFDSINTFFALVDAVFIGLELMSFAWAGPVGWALAIVGVVVALVQLIWNLVSPPPPPPDPVQEFISGPLTQAGFVKA